MNASPSTTDLADSVPPYLDQIADLLRGLMPKAWKWAASDELAAADAEANRLDLLRSSIRLDRQKHAEIYSAADATAAAIGLADANITLYQGQNPAEWNATAVALGKTTHLVLHGPLAEKLGRIELTAVLAHEMGHVLLRQLQEGKYATAHRLLESLASDPSAAVSHLESARLAKLYAEIFCDRVACHIVDDANVVISALLKIGTQSNEVDSESYFDQADEIFAADSNASQQNTHPEMHIRARAIQAWATDNAVGDGDTQTSADKSIAEMIQGSPQLDRLDLIAQSSLTSLTRRIVDAFFRHRWLRTDAALSHAKLFFENYQPTSVSNEQLHALADEIKTCTPSIKQYASYLLLDFATSDRNCENLPLAVALDLAERFSLSDTITDLAKKELRLRVKQIRDLNKKKADLIAAADQGDLGA
ncbi:M48 family metalloprotease [Planctomycetes bacterium K23_9]|uniref:Heat shock protein HtpX n=1 Tax=Stieleria marina TaxID=1930275 RepID=A0A517P2H8_9BACT|nr:heat shock protein HtpX [Planctomycetes bacterium K23_9]